METRKLCFLVLAGGDEQGDGVRLIFEDETLRRLAFDPAFVPKKWSAEVVKAYRKKLQLIQAASNEVELSAIRSLNLEKLKGDRASQYSVRLNRQFRLVLRFRSEPDGRCAVIIELVDYH